MAIPKRDILCLLRDTCRKLDDYQSLEVFAKRAGWSKFHLHREFRSVTGETPKQYTQRLRLERAAAALVASNKSVLAIAIAAGFRSHEVFVRAFRRHFGQSPTQYRRRGLIGATQQMHDRHQAFVNALSPCIRLFHISLFPKKEEPTVRSNSMATTDITRITLEEQPILYIRRQVGQSAPELQALFAECFPKLFGYGMQTGLAITGNPIARYVDVTPGLWTVDCVMPLSQPADATEELEAGVLSGGPVVKGIHFGPYEQLKDSYVAMQTWINDEGLTPNGPHWEQYVTDPGQEPEPTKWQTDIYWPVK